MRDEKSKVNVLEMKREKNIWGGRNGREDKSKWRVWRECNEEIMPKKKRKKQQKT